MNCIALAIDICCMCNIISSQIEKAKASYIAYYNLLQRRNSLTKTSFKDTIKKPYKATYVGQAIKVDCALITLLKIINKTKCNLTSSAVKLLLILSEIAAPH